MIIFWVVIPFLFSTSAIFSTGSILFVLFSIGTLFLYVFFFDSTETTQDERYQQHDDQHILEAEKLDSIIHVLEETRLI